MSFEYFKFSEFDCSCCGKGSGKQNMNHDFILFLDKIRKSCGFGLAITSGYRCPLHPVEERKETPGVHSTGMACDVGVSGKDAYDLLKLVCADDRVKGIGVNQKGSGRFIHIDVKEESPRPNVWSY